ncbi:cupin domain-containing protein [Paralcaligenes ureilyticus]|uniref:(S)-ureidoglycine aminohydrolase cupin domain-containing protein n=1 Tax=Paralcaligenes ureilyticus TaxID=627131 RepID=A0A4R3MBB6_9BURK|nr:cupin domain-containing protein [Paralcaligenes ureilyticus]TCT09549.1 hypothetical protein EDC26_103168 [Paralcaligenes ureilyticus]
MKSRFILIKRAKGESSLFESLAAKNIVAGNPEQKLWPLYEDAPTGQRAGVWESEAGSWQVEISGYTEFCVLTEGSVAVVDENQTEHLLEAGDSLVMQDGFRGVWKVADRVKKYYFIVNQTSSNHDA